MILPDKQIPEEIKGEVEIPYNPRENAKYNERTEYPVESMMFKNFR